MGITGAEDEYAIVGGTRELARADGTIKHKLVRNTTNDNYRQLDIHAFYAPLVVSRIYMTRKIRNIVITQIYSHMHVL
jgi:hypothetical protein